MAHTYKYWYQWKDNFKQFLLIWNMTGKKTTLKPAVAAKNSDATNLTRHFEGGGVILFGRRYDTLKQFVW